MSNFIEYVFVDGKEQEPMIKKTIAFFKTKGVVASKKTLGDYGDVAVFLSSHQILNVERKTIADFCSSYMTGHIQDQAVRMNKVSYNYCCIVYGDIQDLKRLSSKVPGLDRLTQKSIDKMAANLEVLYGLPVFFVKNEAQYFSKIVEIAEIVHKSSGKKVQVKSKITIKNRPDINILTIAPKIGEKTAMLLLDNFKTPKAVLDAPREELLKIKGIGDATISDIKNLKKVFEEGFNE